MISGMDMRFRWIAAILSATLAAAPAMAATGRAGLWNVTTALRASSFTVAPGLAAMLRRTGFRNVTAWTDQRNWFALFYAAA